MTTVTSITNSLLGAAALTASTTVTTGSTSSGYWTLTLPWWINYLGNTYNTIGICTYGYITFGTSSSAAYANYNVPLYYKMLLGVNIVTINFSSCQRIYYGLEGISPNQTYRIRYEGTSASSGTLGSPNIVWEVVFYQNNINQIDIQFGVNANAITTNVGLPINFSYGICSDQNLVQSLTGVLNAGSRLVSSSNSSGDLYYNYVVLLLHGNGANLSTTIIDNEIISKTATVTTGANISTTQSKFGGSSIQLSSTTGSSPLTFVSVPDWQFGAGAFTVECWVYVTSNVTSTQHIIGQWGSVSNYSWHLAIGNNNTVIMETSSTNAPVAGTTVTSANNTLNIGSWNHLAITRNGNVFNIWCNGISVGTYTDASALYNSALGLAISYGGSSLPQYFIGYLNDVRITKGVARYTTTFTPPVSQFPNISQAALGSSVLTISADSPTYFNYKISPLAPTAAAVVADSKPFLTKSQTPSSIWANSNTAAGISNLPIPLYARPLPTWALDYRGYFPNPYYSSGAFTYTYPTVGIPVSGSISGQVQENGTAVTGRRVLLYYRPTGQLINQTVSNAYGNYTFTGLEPSTSNYFVVGLNLLPLSYDAVIHDTVTPL